MSRKITCNKDSTTTPGIRSGAVSGNMFPVVFTLAGNGNIFLENHLALVIFTAGSAVISAAGTRYSVVSPGAFCFRESEHQKIESAHEVRGKGVYFRPAMVNTSLNYDNIAGDRSTLSFTERLDGDFLTPFTERSAAYSGFITMGPELADRISSLIALMGDELQEKKDGFWPCRSRSYLLELLFLVFKVYKSGTCAVQKVDDSLSGRIIHYIHCNFTEKILVSDLCTRFETNKTTLNRLVRDATGSSVIEYLNRFRVQHACLLLRDTSLLIQEIAYRAGFGDVVHFGRMFRKFTGSAPREYRKLYRS